MRFTNLQHLRFTAKLTMFTLLINLLLPFFVVYVPASVAASHDSDSIVFCTSQGVKLVDLQSIEDGSYLDRLDEYPLLSEHQTTVEQETKQAANHYECALCFVAQLHLNDVLFLKLFIFDLQPEHMPPPVLLVTDYVFENFNAFSIRAPPQLT